jgi:DNA-binding transcriptional LysR family regulator
MNITFRQMKLFLALADTGSVTQAAKVMHVTQPTASMQLREISDSVGLPLYELFHRQCRLTDAGRELATTVRSMMDQWEAFEQYVNGERGLTRGKLKIAVVSTAKYFMPRLIGEFCKAYPEIEIALEILNRDGVIERLSNNRDDLYIMSMPPEGIDLDDTILMPNPIVVIASEKMTPPQTREMTLSELQDCRFILREKGSGTRSTIDQFFKTSKFQPNIRLELGSNEAIREAVAGELGIGVISKHALSKKEVGNGVRILSVEGFPLQSSWHIVHPSKKQLSPVASAFKSHLKSSCNRSHE